MLRLSTGLRNKIMGAGISGKSAQNLLAGGMVNIYSGAQPGSADNAESGTLLLAVTLASGAFVAGADGASTNGLTFDDAVSGAISKAAAETWSGVGLADGSAGWFRFYASEQTLGSSTTAVRFDGSVASSGGQLTMADTSIALGATNTVTDLSVSLPAS